MRRERSQSVRRVQPALSERRDEVNAACAFLPCKSSAEPADDTVASPSSGGEVTLRSARIARIFRANRIGNQLKPPLCWADYAGYALCTGCQSGFSINRSRRFESLG